MILTKFCRQCKLELPALRFSRDCTRKTKLRQVCRFCDDLNKRNRYHHKPGAKAKVRARTRAREILKTTKACPSYANLKAIEKIYFECEKITKETNIPHHVDHRIPLKGRTVCGFHIETNLCILNKHSNLSKHNKFNRQDAEYIEQEMMEELRAKGLARQQTCLTEQNIKKTSTLTVLPTQSDQLNTTVAITSSSLIKLGFRPSFRVGNRSMDIIQIEPLTSPNSMV